MPLLLSMVFHYIFTNFIKIFFILLFKVSLNNYLHTYAEFPCICGSAIHVLNKVDIITKTNKTIASTTSGSNHTRQKSNSTDHCVGSENSLSKHMRQPSSSNEMPKVHRVKSNNSVPGSASSLQSPSKSSLPFEFSFTQSQTTKQQQQQQFFYYVDPRFSSNFISIFNSIKRKIANKGFQF